MDAAEQLAAIAQQAVDDAHRAQLAFLSGNMKAYWKEIGDAAQRRVDEAYKALDGPTNEPDAGNGTTGERSPRGTTGPTTGRGDGEPSG